MGLKSFVLKHLGKNLDHNNKIIKFSKNVAENQYLVFRFSNQNYDPSEIENGGTWTRVEGSAYNDWKWGYDSRNWTGKFANCFNTGYAVSVIDGNTTDVTNMSKLFMSCINLESVTMNDVSNLRNASQMFDNCKQLITVDMQHTNAVTDMHLMFHHCDDLTVAPNLDTSSVKNMINMFSYCQSLTTVPVYDTSSVTKMAGMFDHCTALTTAPGLNTSKVKYAENMFDGCTALAEVPDMDLPECVNMNSMFKNCENVNSGALDLYTAMMDSTVTHTDTFTNCGIKSIPGLAELKQIPKDWGGLKEEQLAANTLRFRFADATFVPTGIDNDGTWSKVVGSEDNDWDWTYDNADWSGQFTGCLCDDDVTIIDAGDLTGVYTTNRMFKNCTSLNGVCDNVFNNVGSAQSMFAGSGLTKVPANSFNEVTDGMWMFDGCDSLESIGNDTFEHLKNAKYMFNECGSLDMVPDGSFREVTEAACMFYKCLSLNEVGTDSLVSVTDATNMFYGCTSLSEVDTAFTLLSNAYYMFFDCANLSEVTQSNAFDAVTNAQCMFANCSKLASIPSDTFGSVENATDMFSNCKQVSSGSYELYTQLLDQGVTSHYRTFDHCGSDTESGLAALMDIPKDWGGLKEELAANTLRFRFEDDNYDPTGIDNGGTWSKVSGSTYNDWDWTYADQEQHFDELFKDAFDETTCVSIIKAGDLSNVLTTTSLFARCSGLTSICGGLFNAAEVADSMFSGCTLLESIPENLCSNIHLGSFMFADCVSLTSIPEGVFNKLTDGRNMFAGCVGLTSLPTTLFPSLLYGDEMFADCINVSEGAYDLYNNFAKSGDVTMHYNMFANCGSNTTSGLQDLTQIPKDWGGLAENIAANTLRFHFDDNSYNPSSNKGSWTQVSDDGTDGCVWDWHCDDNDWSDAFSHKFTTTRATMIAAGNTFDVTNMDSMFDACSALDSIVLFDTSNVTYMQFMFNKCTSLSEVPSFDTSNVTTMRDMFYQCTSLTALPLFDTVNVTDMSYLCYECTALTAVPLLDTSNVTAIDNAFAYCKNVETGALALYESASDGIVESHNDTFVLCGKNTNGGLYDLEQIPTDWGGLPLPANTLRFRFEDPDFDPSAKTYTVVNNWTGEVSEEVRPISSVGTWTKVTYSEYNDWNWYYDKNYWSSSLKGALVDTPTRLMLAGDTSSVIHMEYLFQDCTQLVSIDAPIDTSSVEYAFEMFSGCTSLQKIPDLDLSNATDDNSFKNMFKGCSSLVTAPKLTLPSTTLVDLDYMFRDCTSLTTVPLFDTSNVQSMRSMFFECTSLTDVPLFDTSNVTNMRSMFLECSSLTTVPLFDTSNVTDMNGMFDECTSLTTVPLFDTSNVTDMHSMFDNCTSLTTVPLFDTSNVTNMSGMLFGCSSLSVIPLFDTKSVHAVSTMFCNCENVTAGALEFYNSVKDKTYEEGGTQKPVSHYNTFTNCGSEEVRLRIPVDWGGLKVELPANTLRFRFENTDYNPTVIENGGTWTKVDDSSNSFNDWDWTCDETDWGSKFDDYYGWAFNGYNNNTSIIAAGDTSSVTAMHSMFYGCTSLTEVELFDTSNVTIMNGMFAYCTSLTSIPVFNTSNVTDMGYMFLACMSLTNVPEFDTSNVTGMSHMFIGCSNIETGMLALYQQASSTGKVKYYTRCFTNAGTNTESGRAELNQIPVDWGGLNVELPANTLRFRFETTDYNPTAINNGGTWTKVTDSGFNDWDWTCTDTDWSSKFRAAFTVDNTSIIAAGDTSSVTGMGMMFADCNSLTSVSLFNTSNVTDMSHMFRDCESLISVPLFDTSKVTNMEDMFLSCMSLTYVPLFNTSNVTSMIEMFYGCRNIQSGMLDLYRQASSTGKVSSHNDSFADAGTNTESGRAELNQIPVDWGGLAE